MLTRREQNQATRRFTFIMSLLISIVLMQCIIMSAIVTLQDETHMVRIEQCERAQPTYFDRYPSPVAEPVDM